MKYLRILNPLTGLFWCLSFQSLLAADGRLEINQACVDEGCFPGDGPGFPVQITQPGSYVLTGEVNQSSPDVHAISVQADRVTLDLNGFGLQGPGEGEGYGIELRGNRVDVRNGQIIGFDSAIYPFSATTFGHHTSVAQIKIDALDVAIRLAQDALVRDCDISSVGTGIIVSGGARVIGNRIKVVGNEFFQWGIDADVSAIIQGNVITDAGGTGINVGSASQVSSNLVSGSGFSGIQLTGGQTVVNGNTVVLSQQYGVQIDNGDNLIIGNVAVNNNQSGGAFTNLQVCASCTFVNNHAP